MQSGGGPQGGQLLRSAIDAHDDDEILGKVYDSRLIARLAEYLSPVKKHLVFG